MTITKRILSGILALGIFCSVFGIPVLADGVEEDVVAAQSIGDIPAKSYVLMEASSGKVLMEQNADEQMPPASITKIMVMLLLMERLEPVSYTHLSLIRSAKGPGRRKCLIRYRMQKKQGVLL